MKITNEYPTINVIFDSELSSVDVDIDPEEKFVCEDLETEVSFLNEVRNIKYKYLNKDLIPENKTQLKFELKNLVRSYVNSGLIYKRTPTGLP